MKTAKFLKRPVVVVLLVAVIGIIVFSVVRYLMGGKEQFVEGAIVGALPGSQSTCNPQTSEFYDSLSKDCISTKANADSRPGSGIYDFGSDKSLKDINKALFIGNPPECAIEKSSMSGKLPTNLTVGCKKKSTSGNTVVKNFDLTKCNKNDATGLYMVKNNDGKFECAENPGPTTMPPGGLPPWLIPKNTGPTTKAPASATKK
jgi:hypothetical protein